MIRAGKFDRRITVERKTEIISASGAVASTWSNVATVRAELLQDAVTEAATGPGEAETIRLDFRVRWLAGITTADRIIYDGHAFDLVELKEIGRRRALDLRCERIRQ